jgi:hypothetical protein
MEGNLHALATEYAAVAALKPHPENPRRGRVEAIKESLEATGQYRPIVVSRATGHVLAGNHTLKAAIGLGWDKIAVTYLDGLTPQDERRILLADNRTADMGTYDDEALLAALQAYVDDAEDLVGTGYNLDDMEDLQAILDAVPQVAAPSTDAHYNETDEELAERQEKLGNYQTLKGQGLAEVVLILTNDKKDQLYLWIERLRQDWGPDLTNGEVVHAALARLVEKANAPAVPADAPQPTSGVPSPFTP